MGIRETLISEAQASEIRARVDAFERWRNGRTSYHASEVPADVPQTTNEERGRLEQFEVWRDKPSDLFAYIKAHPHAADTGACVVTVWTGAPLGYGRWGSVWRSNMGDKRRSVSVTIAGETYSGTAFVSAGDYCRLRKVRGKGGKA